MKTASTSGSGKCRAHCRDLRAVPAASFSLERQDLLLTQVVVFVTKEPIFEPLCSGNDKALRASRTTLIAVFDAMGGLLQSAGHGRWRVFGQRRRHIPKVVAKLSGPESQLEQRRCRRAGFRPRWMLSVQDRRLPRMFFFCAMIQRRAYHCSIAFPEYYSRWCKEDELFLAVPLFLRGSVRITTIQGLSATYKPHLQLSRKV